MLQVFYLDVAYVEVVIHISCKCMFVNVSFVSNISCKCCMTRCAKWAQIEVVPSERS
jgi:hypothetical protein